jgi:hypothetical protein
LAYHFGLARACIVQTTPQWEGRVCPAPVPSCTCVGYNITCCSIVFLLAGAAIFHTFRPVPHGPPQAHSESQRVLETQTIAGSSQSAHHPGPARRGERADHRLARRIPARTEQYVSKKFHRDRRSQKKGKVKHVPPVTIHHGQRLARVLGNLRERGVWSAATVCVGPRASGAQAAQHAIGKLQEGGRPVVPFHFWHILFAFSTAHPCRFP